MERLRPSIRIRTAIALAAMAASLVAPGASVAAPSEQGTVELPAATPTPGRLAWVATTQTNGLIASVVPLGNMGIVDGRPYSLRKLSGVEPVDLDVWFYSDLWGDNGLGHACPRTSPTGVGNPVPDGNGGEDGQIWCGDSNGDGQITPADRARYAVVTLFTGAHARFRLSW